MAVDRRGGIRFRHRPEAVPAHDYRLVMLRGSQEYCLQPVMEDGLIEQACQQHPDWCSAGISESEFSDFAKAFGGLTHREAHVFYTKHDFWRARAGVSQYHYGA